MPTTLVTGAAGLIGTHLCAALRAAGETVMAADLRAGPDIVRLDVTDAGAVRAMVADLRPAVIHHLAAQSLPVRSWSDPAGTLATNVLGTAHVFEAIRALPGYDPVVVVACSSAEYGAAIGAAPVDEDANLLPLHPYGVSKVAQDLLAFQYWRAAGIRAIRARLFNTTGPGKTDDVASNLCRRALAVAAGRAASVRIGNADARRAILDARDAVAALTALAALGAPGEAYNICAETVVRVGDLVPMLESLLGVALPVTPDPDLLRPADEPVIAGSTAKLRRATGWVPRVPLADTLRAMLDHLGAG